MSARAGPLTFASFTMVADDGGGACGEVSSSEEPGRTDANSTAAAGTEDTGERTTDCQLQLASEAKD